MNFLYVKAKQSIYDIPWTLTEMGYEVDIFDPYDFDPLVHNEGANNELYTKLTANHFDYVISYLFFADISNICQKLNIKYISWTYDSPLVSFFDEAVFNSCNYTFIFDKAEYEYLKSKNVPHIYYLPMATNLTRTGALDISEEDEKNFGCDISFIGNLYEANSYNSIIHFFPDHLANELKSYLVKNLCNWEQRKPWPAVSKEVASFMEENLSANDWNPTNLDNSLYFGMLVLTRKLAEMDRITVLNALSERHSVHLYTNSNSSHLQNVKTHKGVDYYTTMNKVFYLSKINLNITLPSIETGLPQRIFDIMGCGGFVLTNYQEEIDDLFTIGEDIEVFHNIPELLDKTAYYLTHEKERIQIAMNGYMKVRDKYNYVNQIQIILDTIKEESN